MSAIDVDDEPVVGLDEPVNTQNDDDVYVTLFSRDRTMSIRMRLGVLRKFSKPLVDLVTNEVCLQNDVNGGNLQVCTRSTCDGVVDVDNITLMIMCAYMDYAYEHPPKAIVLPLVMPSEERLAQVNNDPVEEYTSLWEASFMNIVYYAYTGQPDGAALFDLMLAAHMYAIEPLEMLCAVKIAFVGIIGKTTAQMREAFGFKNDWAVGDGTGMTETQARESMQWMRAE